MTVNKAVNLLDSIGCRTRVSKIAFTYIQLYIYIYIFVTNSKNIYIFFNTTHNMQTYIYIYALCISAKYIYKK